MAGTLVKVCGVPQGPRTDEQVRMGTMSNSQAPATRSATAGASAAPARAPVMLTMATIGFAVNFWAWALLSPLSPKFQAILHLSSFQQALVVAVPVVVGSCSH